MRPISVQISLFVCLPMHLTEPNTNSFMGELISDHFQLIDKPIGNNTEIRTISM